MKLSYTTVSIAGKLNFDESVKLAKETGCAGLEFRTGYIFPHGIEISLSKEARKEKRRRIEDNYLEIACLNSEFMLHNPDAVNRFLTGEISEPYFCSYTYDTVYKYLMGDISITAADYLKALYKYRMSKTAIVTPLDKRGIKW